MPFEDHVRRALAELDDSGLLRRARTVESAQGPTVRLDGRDVLLLCSNNYLGLASHPALADAHQQASREWGGSAVASRLISGTMTPHRAAERAAAALCRTESAVLFSSGYAANVGALQALVGPRDVVFSDALNHASLIDGCRLSRAQVHIFRHCDPDHLSALMAAHRPARGAALVVTDTLFSMDGDLAPVAELRALCDRWDAGLLVDEAHAIGVLGPGGRGHCAAVGVVPDVLVGTLGKALGLGGAFVAGSTALAQLIENRARSFVYSTGVPPALAASVPTAVALAVEADDRRARLAAHAARLRAGLAAAGLEVAPGTSAIIPVMLGSTSRAIRASQLLLERGVFVHGVRPPTVPSGTSRLRVVPIATHTDDHLDRALEAFSDLARALR